MVGISAFVFGGTRELQPAIFPEQPQQGVALRKEVAPDTNVKTVKVYVTGAVAKPGVYDVPAKLRSLDAIKLAGGFTETADVERVNVTKVLRDGMQINVPLRKKNLQPKQVALGDAKPRERSFKRPNGYLTKNGMVVPQGIYAELVTVSEGTVVSLSRATVKELCSLPGLHWELARRIVEYRDQKAFQRIEDVLLVRGMTPKIYNDLYKYVVL